MIHPTHNMHPHSLLVYFEPDLSKFRQVKEQHIIKCLWPDKCMTALQILEALKIPYPNIYEHPNDVRPRICDLKQGRFKRVKGIKTRIANPILVEDGYITKFIKNAKGKDITIKESKWRISKDNLLSYVNS